MECSSFIASSAFLTWALLVKVFARLSGSTAEFMDICKLMFIGPDLYEGQTWRCRDAVGRQPLVVV
jgi:hypothetical protein